MRSALTATVVAALVVAGCSGSSDSSPEATTVAKPPQPTSTVRAPSRIQPGTITVSPLRSPPAAEQLPAFRAARITTANYPAGLAAAPDGRIFYSELWAGRIRVIRRDGSLDPTPWADVNRQLGIRWTRYYHGGLSGLAFDPDFASNHFVYAVTQVPNKRTGLPARSLILRFTEKNGRGTACASS